MDRGRHDHLGVGREGRPRCRWGCSPFYQCAGLCFTGTLGWALCRSSGAASPATVGTARCHGGGRGLVGVARVGWGGLAGEPGAATGCSWQGAELEASASPTVRLPWCYSQGPGLDVVLGSRLPVLSQKSLFLTGKWPDHFFVPVTRLQRDARLPALAGFGRAKQQREIPWPFCNVS